LAEEGPLKMALNISKSLSEEYEFSFIGLKNAGAKDASSELRQHKFHAASLNLSRSSCVLIRRQTLQRIINEYKPDIVHSHLLSADIFCARLLNSKNVKVMTTVHNNALEDYYNSHGMLGLVAGHTHLRLLRKFENVVACSKSVSRNLLKYGVQNEIISVGVDVDQFAAVDKKTKVKLRQNLNQDISDQDNIYLCLSNLIERKNIEFVIKSFMKADLHNCNKLLIVGGGELYSELKLKYSSSNVIFFGRVDRVDMYLQLADYYISASRSEGLPAGVIEALASGLTCLLSNIEAHVELLNRDDDTFFALKNTLELEKLFKVTSTKKITPEIRKRNIQLAQKHSVAKMASHYQKYYNQLI
jgi:glycosyltransferase involved in cell wall biosynthesis